MELVEFHVLQRKSLAEHDAQAVAGQGVRVGGGLVHTARAAGGENNCLGVEHVDIAGRQLVGDDAGGHRAVRRLGECDVQCVELVEELDIVLDAVLVQRLQDHVPGAVSGVAGPAYRRLTVIASVATEAALIDSALGCPVERHTHLFEIEDGVDRLLAHDLHGILVGEVVATLDGVEGVPFPVVFFDVGQRGAHAALGCPGVATCRVQLGQYRSTSSGSGLHGGAHTRTARADDDNVVPMFLNDGGTHSEKAPNRCSG
ncbi:Uncharacterised protein [Mycobacteroides abscessus subsp. abscessus]|nr:Uncharacterised protein [Mycobacteroides abscessus subsp. abscessus]